MTFYAATALINFATSIIFGLLVFIRNPRNKINYSFALFSFSVALWSLGYFIWQISTNAQDALFWSKALMFFAIVIPAFYTHFVFVLTGLTRKKIILLVLAYILLGAFLPADIFGSLFIKEVKPLLGFKFWPIAGPLFHIFLAIWMAYVIFNTYLLYKAHKSAEGIYKNQIKYVFWGLALAFTGGITNYFLWYEIPIPPFANILVTAYVALTAIAIIRHRLMDFRLVLARTIAYLIIVGAIALIYVGSAFLVSSLLLGFEINIKHLLFYLALTFILAISFSRLRGLIEKLTDSLLFKGHYDSSQLLSKLGNIMSTNIELEPLSSQILQTLTSEMKISRTALVFLEKGTIYKISEEGYNVKQSYFYSQLAPLLNQQLLVFDDLPEGELKQLMRTLNISVSVSLQVKEEKVGLLLFGEKASGETYSNEDLKVLEILSSEVAITIQNAKSFDQIKRFNVTLSEEVRRATQDLQYANERLTKLDQLKDDFVSIASHELRTPMAAIRSYAWMALHRSDVPISEKVEKYLVRILMSTERLINLVNDMLNISRIESGRVEINPEPVDLISLCKDIVDEVYYSKSTEKNVKFVLLEQPVPKVFADPEKLRQVVLNILGNALKFSPNGGKITIGFFTDGKVTETYIKDEGPGISHEDMGRLFKKFGRLDSTYTAAATSGGTGLGLFISKSLIDFMHGRIWAVSEGIGKGSTFSFALPVASLEVIKNADKYTIKVAGEAKGLESVAL